MFTLVIRGKGLSRLLHEASCKGGGDGSESPVYREAVHWSEGEHSGVA